MPSSFNSRLSLMIWPWKSGWYATYIAYNEPQLGILPICPTLVNSHPDSPNVDSPCDSDARCLLHHRQRSNLSSLRIGWLVDWVCDGLCLCMFGMSGLFVHFVVWFVWYAWFVWCLWFVSSFGCLVCLVGWLVGWLRRLVFDSSQVVRIASA